MQDCVVCFRFAPIHVDEIEELAFNDDPFGELADNPELVDRTLDLHSKIFTNKILLPCCLCANYYVFGGTPLPCLDLSPPNLLF